MIVTPIASTTLIQMPASIADTEMHAGFLEAKGRRSEEIDYLAEFAGRSCYQSWNKPNPATATPEGYLANIIQQEHFSVLEHGSVTFYIEGVSRSLTHELIRHRHLSYSELSQRYVNIEDADFITPPALQELWNGVGGFGPDPTIDDTWAIEAAVEAYAGLVEDLVMYGFSRKQAREAARAVMPNATETKIVVTGNLRAWRDMLHKRWHVAADAEIRELAGEILGHLRELAPHSVQDIPAVPFE